MLKLLVPDNHKACRTAAGIFASLWREVTGAAPETVTRDDGGSPLIVFGADFMNPFVHDKIMSGVIDGFRLRTGSDDYHLLSAVENGRHLLFLAGGRPRSLFYAVYRFFELRADCRYFWDGDRIPERKSIETGGLDLAESPRFQYRGIRYFAHRGLKRFQAELWDFEDWRREIDWLLKKRLNLFMLRIGIDDLFQKAFPEIVPYPQTDGRSMREHPRSYDDRTQFRSLEYRGELRKKILAYARERDLMHPEDCGTMTHWYSRTPPEFLEAVKPEFLPQWTQDYGEPSGKVWDFRIRRNLENYFKLTGAHIRHYGSPDLFHTIGLAERGCFQDRRKNQQLKLYAYRLIEEGIHAGYPHAPLLIATWDFVVWSNEEVKELVAGLNPENTLLWDYISDTYDEIHNFTNWGVTGKFPYVFGIFHAFAASTELRGNYSAIERRLPKAADDPMCRGMIFWPENSHADTLMLEYFTANSWTPSHLEIRPFITEFCRRRYQRKRKEMERIWQELLPLIQLGYWRWNQQRECEVYPDYAFTLAHSPQHLCDLTPQTLERNRFLSLELKPHLKHAAETLRLLSETEITTDPFVFRDAVDLARTAVGRVCNYAFADLTLMMEAWRNGQCGAAVLMERLDLLEILLKSCANILEAHEDFSMWRSLCELEKSGTVNPSFEDTLKGNAENGYCRSYVYELFRGCYLPEFKAYRIWITEKITGNDCGIWRRDENLSSALKEIENRFYACPLREIAPDTGKAAANLARNLLSAMDAVIRIAETASQGNA